MPDASWRSASIFAQTLRSCGWPLIKAMYLIEGGSVQGTAPVELVESGVPLRWAYVDQHRRGDQQYKKDRQQHWGYQPLTKFEGRGL
jgi:hypothetical protein